MSDGPRDNQTGYLKAPVKIPKLKKQYEKVPAVGPTRRTIENLLRQLSTHSYVWDDPEYEAITQKISEREKEFANSPPMKKLFRERERIEKKRTLQRRALKAKLEHVRNLYWAEGVTPRVIREVQKLAEATKRT